MIKHLLYTPISKPNKFTSVFDAQTLLSSWISCDLSTRSIFPMANVHDKTLIPMHRTLPMEHSPLGLVQDAAKCVILSFTMVSRIYSFRRYY